MSVPPGTGSDDSTTSPVMDDDVSRQREPEGLSVVSGEARRDGADDCERWREAVSALADGEHPGIDERLVDAHLRRCEACSRFAAVVGRSQRSTSGGEPDESVGGSRRIVRAALRAERSSHPVTVRVLLAVVAAEVIVLSAPDLVRTSGSSGDHDARHLGAFSIAYGVALLVVALRPARARAVLPVAAVVAAALTITAAVDLLEGRIPLLGEALHIPEVVSVVLVWMLARHPPLAAGRYRRQG